MLVFALIPLVVDPWSLVRVEDPNYPGAETHSATGSVLLEPPPPGIAWTEEDVPVTDSFVAEEALAALAVHPWHDAGATGAGVKIAVFDLQWFSSLDLAEELGEFTSHDCFADPTCEQPIDFLRPRFRFEQGVHGIACSEIVRDIAPDAQLHLVRTQGRTTLENAIDWAVREDIDIISMSLSFLNSSFHDGRGPVSELAAKAAAGGVLLVTSSGNYADSHWGGPWVDGDNDGRLDFDGDNQLDVRLGAGPQTTLVQWDQRLNCGETDLDLRLVDDEGRILGVSEVRQLPGADRCQPYERVPSNVQEAQWGHLEVRLHRGTTVDLDVDLLSTRGRLRPAMAEGSIADPAASPLAFAVGAVRAEGYFANDIEAFSSWGSRTIGYPKPDIVGPNGVSTAAYGARGFFGTSASTPAVAAAIALIMSEDPTLSSWEAARILQQSAFGGQPIFSEQSPAFGAGKARLPSLGVARTGCVRGDRGALFLLFPLMGLARRRRRSG
jgi:hypothetical protein